MHISLSLAALVPLVLVNPAQSSTVSVANLQLASNFAIETNRSVDLSVQSSGVIATLDYGLSCVNATAERVVVTKVRLEDTDHTDKIEGFVLFKCTAPRITLRDTTDTNNFLQSTVEITASASVQSWLETTNRDPITRPPTPEPSINGTNNDTNNTDGSDENEESGVALPCAMNFDSFDVELGGLGGARCV
jgi:hypothetical protein